MNNLDRFVSEAKNLIPFLIRLFLSPEISSSEDKDAISKKEIMKIAFFINFVICDA